MLIWLKLIWKSGCTANYVAKDTIVSSVLCKNGSQNIPYLADLEVMGMTDAVVISFTHISHNFTLITINVFLPSNNNCKHVISEMLSSSNIIVFSCDQS